MVVTILMKHPPKMSNQTRFNLLVILTIVSNFFTIIQVIHSAEVLSDPRYRPVALAETVKVINPNINNNINDDIDDPVTGAQFVGENAPVIDKVVQADEMGPPLSRSGAYLSHKRHQIEDFTDAIDETFVDSSEDDVHPDDPMADAYMDDQYKKIKNHEDKLEPLSDVVGEVDNSKQTNSSLKEIDPIKIDDKIEGKPSPILLDDKGKLNFPYGTSLSKPIYPDRVTRNGTKTISHYKIMVPVWVPHKMPDGADVPINRQHFTTAIATTKGNDAKNFKINRSIQTDNYANSLQNSNVVITNSLENQPEIINSPSILTVNSDSSQTNNQNPAFVTTNSDGVKVAKTIREMHKTYEAQPVPQTVLTKYVMRKDKNTPYNMSPNVDPSKEIILGESESVYGQS